MRCPRVSWKLGRRPLPEPGFREVLSRVCSAGGGAGAAAGGRRGPEGAGAGQAPPRSRSPVPPPASEEEHGPAACFPGVGVGVGGLARFLFPQGRTASASRLSPGAGGADRCAGAEGAEPAFPGALTRLPAPARGSQRAGLGAGLGRDPEAHLRGGRPVSPFSPGGFRSPVARSPETPTPAPDAGGARHPRRVASGLERGFPARSVRAWWGRPPPQVLPVPGGPRRAADPAVLGGNRSRGGCSR